jgi:hypothetical protein
MKWLLPISWDTIWIGGKANPDNIVSKHWGYQHNWHLFQPILLYSGNTGNLVAGE